ncbi:MAG TPA: hypothetical protein VFL17_21335 [Anaerolineae bacterium]|nr:hypothetical protein [Anaerolineae bacterium]
MRTSASEWPTANTDHGLLVAFGEFLQQHGLLARLMQVPLPQKTRTFAPQTKLVEFLAGIMSGIAYLSDLNDGPHPLAKDPIAARAWGQPGFAHYSGVSRTLDVCNAETVAAVERAIADFSRPFIDQVVHDLLRRGEPVIYDLDLTGQAVSPTSQTYPGVAFGWMNDGVKLGYQLARVCLSPPDQDRVWLAGFHHPGDTVSAACVQDLIRAAETHTHIRPRRRPELVQQRIAAHQDSLNRTQRLLEQQQARLTQLQQTQRDLIGKVYHAHEVLKTPISPGKSTRLQGQVAGWRKRLPRLEQQIATATRVLAQHRARLTQQQVGLADLQAWQAQLEADNRTNPDAPPYCEVRMDAGFVSGENLTWLIEMGYCPNTKAPNDRTTRALRARVTPRTRWVRVGDNAEMVAWGEYVLHGCPYPLTVALERFKVGHRYKYATLIHYRDDGWFPTLPAWFQHYNARQTIEAGNKEMKGPFHVQHLMSRSLAGIRLQVLFTGLAANVVRWCVPWLYRCAATPTAKFTRVLDSPKHLVRMAANTDALVQHTYFGTALQFGPQSPLSGVTLFLRGVPAFQLALGFNQPCEISSG